MKKTAAFLMALGLALPAITLAQDSGDARPARRDGPPRQELNRDGGAPRDGVARDQRGPGQEGPGDGRRPVSPLFAALDTNHDGVIDETEMKQAPEALAKLDKNGDGKLTPDELRPTRPEGGRSDAQPGRPGRDQGPARPRGDGGSANGPRPPQDR